MKPSEASQDAPGSPPDLVADLKLLVFTHGLTPVLAALAETFRELARNTQDAQLFHAFSRHAYNLDMAAEVAEEISEGDGSQR